MLIITKFIITWKNYYNFIKINHYPIDKYGKNTWLKDLLNLELIINTKEIIYLNIYKAKQDAIFQELIAVNGKGLLNKN